MTLPRLRIGRLLDAAGLPFTGTLDEIRITTGAKRNLSNVQTAPWASLGEADSDASDVAWVDVVASRAGYADVIKRFTVTRARRGVDGVTGYSSAQVLVYKRSATVPTLLPSNPVDYTFATGVATGLNNGWTQAIPEGTDPLYITAASANSQATTDTISPAEWAGAILYQSSGINTATIFLFKRNDTGTLPAKPTTAITYTFATGVLSGTLDSWTQSAPPVSGGKYLYVTTATALSTSSADTIAPAEWADVQIMAQNGTDGTAGYSASQVLAYQRAAVAPTLLPSSPVIYTFSTAQATGLNNNWTQTIPSGTDPLYVTAASASSQTATDTIAPAEWASPILYQGSTINTATIFLFKRNDTGVVPTAPAVSLTYTFASAALAGDLGGWLQSVPSDAGGKFLYITTATALSTSPTDTIAPGEWAAVRLHSKIATDGTNGTNGPRGNVNVSRQITGAVWSDPEALLALSAAGYGAPQSRDIVTLYNSAAGLSDTRFFDGTAWISVTQYLNGNLFVNGTIAGNKLITGTVVADSLNAADGTFTGALVGATGSFGGTLLAGVLNLESLTGETTSYSPGTYTITIPAGFTTLRATLVGGGGGGARTGYGGGGGGLSIATFTGLTAGATYTLIVGSGGAGAYRAGNLTSNNGIAGGNTSIMTLTAGGGGFGQLGTATWSGPPGAGGTGSTANGSPGQTMYGEQTTSAGGNSGLNYGAGGAGGPGVGYEWQGSDGGLYGGGGASGQANQPGGNGANGKAIIELFNPNSVVVRSEWNTLISALQRQSIATT